MSETFNGSLVYGDSIFDSAIPPNLGPVFLEYKNDPEGAIQRLMTEKTGDARSVITRAELGSIDIFYGSTKAGLAKIADKHPEVVPKLAGLLRNGKIVRKPGAGKVFIVGEGDSADVAVIALDWYGVAKTWVVTSYVDERGVFTGSLKTIDTVAIESARMEVLYSGQQTDNTLDQDFQSVNATLDDVGTPNVAAMMARLKLTGELSTLKKQIDALGIAAGDMLAKLRLVARANEVRKQLGDSLVPVVQPKPVTPEPEQADQEQVKSLREVIAGTHDGKSLPELFAIIQEAVNGLDEAGMLSGEADAVANEAITHWAELEERLSANV
jgi:hypothetical protein